MAKNMFEPNSGMFTLITVLGGLIVLCAGLASKDSFMRKLYFFSAIGWLVLPIWAWITKKRG